MIIFDHPIWPQVSPYARLSEGRDNLDLLQLPDDLILVALNATVTCVACGNPIHPFRRRTKSQRARIANRPEERRLYYASTCAASVNAGCARSTAAKNHKVEVRDRLGAQREPEQPIVRIEIRDDSGLIVYKVETSGREPFEVTLPAGASTIKFVPIVK